MGSKKEYLEEAHGIVWYSDWKSYTMYGKESEQWILINMQDLEKRIAEALSLAYERGRDAEV
jgi:hypothetical protein